MHIWWVFLCILHVRQSHFWSGFPWTFWGQAATWFSTTPLLNAFFGPVINPFHPEADLKKHYLLSYEDTWQIRRQINCFSSSNGCVRIKRVKKKKIPFVKKTHTANARISNKKPDNCARMPLKLNKYQTATACHLISTSVFSTETANKRDSLLNNVESWHKPR